MTSIKDVAKLAGVSTTTVTRVLANSPQVSKELAEKVGSAITALSYRPNLAARSLRKQKASVIGLIISDIRNPFFTEIAYAVENISHKNGLRLILCNTNENPDKEHAYLDLMQDEQASGVILSPTPQGLTLLKAKSPTFPIVIIDRHSGNLANVDNIILDNFNAAKQLTAHLINKGCHDIFAFVGKSTTGQERLQGYNSEMQAHHLTSQSITVEASQEAGFKAAIEILSQKKPQAILASNGLILLGIVNAIKKLNLSTPHNIKLAGFDNNDWTALYAGGISVIEQPTQEIGYTAVELLLQHIKEANRNIRRIILNGTLIIRD